VCESAGEEVAGKNDHPAASNQPGAAQPPGATLLGHGAYFNDESIWHPKYPKFRVSIAAVKMRAALDSNLAGMDIAGYCKAIALQWAAELEGGQPPDKVIPGNLVGAIIGAVRNSAYSAHEHSVRVERARGKQPMRTAKL
jgi:hypothetical protein